MPNQNQVKYLPAGTGPIYCDFSDRVTFLPPWSRHARLIIEGVVAQGRGPRPHFHHFKNKIFYVLEGAVTFQAGGQTIDGKPGDSFQIPRGRVHSLENEVTVPGRALVVISPAGPTGMQQFFVESFTPTTDRSAHLPSISEELVQRMMAAAARNGMEWVKPASRCWRRHQ